MRASLDVKVLIALLDADHSLHARATRQITDVYLLALAVRHAGRFVTFDASVSLDAVRGAEEKYLLAL